VNIERFVYRMRPVGRSAPPPQIPRQATG
jgi:hypothetical protein